MAQSASLNISSEPQTQTQGGIAHSIEVIFDMPSCVKRSEPNPRGIPSAPFVTDIPQFLQTRKVEAVIEAINDLYGKYKFMERSLVARRDNLEKKIPDIKNTLSALQHLIDKAESAEPHDVDFMLHDNVYTQATIQKTKTVGLWLGANVMVEYTYTESKDLLERNLENAKTTLAAVKEDLAYLREQSTIAEVSIARFFNFDVKQRRLSKQQEGTETTEKKE
ncbi:putative Prefoldin subunit 3 [Blattamonas nauphoetae]|uniref:Prefoldin subunit 3 n=1 Tax=Blattamonas nauphoetae TaxID=2049346 RepID=A0ABQ9YLR1_9EUKA|nr:putative Prefoldin subunit 3 [Blattamonas nauphoetae]